jgi:hypothetical protein
VFQFHELQKFKNTGGNGDDQGLGKIECAFYTFAATRKNGKFVARSNMANEPRWLPWPEQVVQWSRKDHSSIIHASRKFPLVIKPKVKGY